MAPAAAWSRSRSSPGRASGVPLTPSSIEARPRVAAQPAVADASVERLDLAGERVLLGLALGGDPGVDRHAEVRGGRHGGSSSLG